MKIVITGATGFVGQNLIPYLNRLGFTDMVLPNREILNAPDDLEIPLDSDAIVHLAGKAHDLKKVSKPDEYYQINFEITKKLYDSFLRSSAQKFIFISSVKAVADSVETELTEQDPADPQTHYGKSKRMAEEYIQSISLPRGKSFYILRPCMIHGPGNKGNLNLLYKFVDKGIPYPLASFPNKRSFLSVENLCFVIKEIIDRPDVDGGIYNLADDTSLSTNELVKLIAGSIGKSPKLWYISAHFMRMIARIGSRLSLPLNTERLNKLTENYCVSNKKIKLALNKPFPLTAVEGLKKTILSFQMKH